LRDYDLRAIDRSASDIHRNSEGTKSVRVGRRNVYERNIQRKHVFSKQRGNLRKEDRNVIAVSAIDRVAYIAPDKERVDAKAVCELRFGIRSPAFGVKVDDLDIPQLGRAAYKSIEENVRSGRDTMDKHTVPRLDC
jgi:hypothetical protein